MYVYVAFPSLCCFMQVTKELTEWREDNGNRVKCTKKVTVTRKTVGISPWKMQMTLGHGFSRRSMTVSGLLLSC